MQDAVEIGLRQAGTVGVVKAPFIFVSLGGVAESLDHHDKTDDPETSDGAEYQEVHRR